MKLDFEKKIAAKCWASEGLWGDLSCEALKEYVHCANCPVYAAAGRALFSRPLPKSALEGAHGVQSAPADAQSAKEDAFFVFKCGLKSLAFDLKTVLRAERWRFVHSIPHKDSNVLKGLVNMGGELLVAVSLAELLELGAEDLENRQLRMLVCRSGADTLVFFADSLKGVSRVIKSDIKDVAAGGAPLQSPFCEKYYERGGESVAILDAELVFHAVTKKYL